jgi:hypothetical protein
LDSGAWKIGYPVAYIPPWNAKTNKEMTMADVLVATLEGGDTKLKETSVDELKGSLRGALLSAGDEGYEEARKIWNGMIDRRPALIVRCAGVSDVIGAVKFSRANGLQVSVRGGGHNVSGNAVCDGGLMIDLSLMNGIRVDPEKRTAFAQGGATLGDLDRETMALGLAVPAGIVTTTGIAGLTLGGGIGWLQRKYGLTCDNLISVDMVTADGQYIKASDTENPDLFWAVKGGGGNFGIVTSFEYRLYPVGPIVLGGMVLYPMEKAPEFLRFYRDFAADVPDELTINPLLRIAPPAPFLPEHVHHKPVVGIAACYAGSIEEGQKVLQPLKEYGSPYAYGIGPKPYLMLQSIFDASAPAGLHYYMKSEFLPDLTNELIDTMASHAAEVTSPLTVMVGFQMGGAIRNIGEDETAFSHRDASYSFGIVSGWRDPGESERHIGWTRGFWEALEPFSAGGAYVNFLSHDDGEDRVKAAYGAEKYRRLVEVKNRYDPTNFFRLNQNIKPSA